MHLHDIRFFSNSALARAVRSLVDCPHVEGCVVDREGLRISFSAPSEQAGALLDRLHRRGELADWQFRTLAQLGA